MDVLVLLPPSETKAPGGAGPPLDLDTLSAPELNPTRGKLADELSTMAHDVPSALSVLGLSERQVSEVERNAKLWQAPTTPALLRYTGVLYDALDVTSMTDAERARADQRLAIVSALFGMLGTTDHVPAYRLSGATTLPGLGSLRTLWRPTLEPVLGDRDDLVVDLRSGPYAALARVPAAISVRVLSEDSRGQRKTVSHHNKSHKGKLARLLVETPGEPSTVDDIVEVATSAGLRMERTDNELRMIVAT